MKHLEVRQKYSAARRIFQLSSQCFVSWWNNASNFYALPEEYYMKFRVVVSLKSCKSEPIPDHIKRNSWLGTKNPCPIKPETPVRHASDQVPMNDIPDQIYAFSTPYARL